MSLEHPASLERLAIYSVQKEGEKCLLLFFSASLFLLIFAFYNTYTYFIHVYFL